MEIEGLRILNTLYIEGSTRFISNSIHYPNKSFKPGLGVTDKLLSFVKVTNYI